MMLAYRSAYANQFLRILQACNGRQRILFVQEILAKKKPVIMFQSPADFFLCPKLMTPMEGKCFVTIEEIKENLKQQLLAIPKSVFQKCFENWEKRWHKCILSEGRGYFEEDKIIIAK